jgi:hypothetical protein
VLVLIPWPTRGQGWYWNLNSVPDNIGPVANDNEVERVRTALEDLCEPLYEAFTWADVLRCERLPELADRQTYGWHATHTVRALAHLRLDKSDLGVWSLTGNHARNGELWLSDGGYRARVLHAISDEQVPPPGTNFARKAYYRNIPLPLEWQLPLSEPFNDKLLLLWRVDPFSHKPAFRVVRPIGNWKWGHRAKTDLDFFLPETAADLRGLHFDPSDRGLEIDLPEEDEGGAEDAGGRSG